MKPEKITFPMSRTNILFVWTMVAIALVIYSISWFALSPVVTLTLEALDEAYAFTGMQETAFDLISTVIYWNPLIAVFGWLLWGFLNSGRRDVRSWEV